MTLQYIHISNYFLKSSFTGFRSLSHQCNEVTDFLRHGEQTPPGPAHSSGSMAEWLVLSCDVNDTICGAIYYCLVAVQSSHGETRCSSVLRLHRRGGYFHTSAYAAVLSPSAPICRLPAASFHIPLSVWNGSKQSTPGKFPICCISLGKALDIPNQW